MELLTDSIIIDDIYSQIIGNNSYRRTLHKAQSYSLEERNKLHHELSQKLLLAIADVYKKTVFPDPEKYQGIFFKVSTPDRQYLFTKGFDEKKQLKWILETSNLSL